MKLYDLTDLLYFKFTLTFFFIYNFTLMAKS